MMPLHSQATEAEQASTAQALARLVFDFSGDAIMVTDAQARVLAVNPAFSRLTGFSADEAVGHTPGFLSSGRHGPEFFAQMRAELKQQGRWWGEVWNRHKDGQVRPVWESITRVDDEAGQPSHYVAVLSDISVLQAEHDRLHHLAHHDALTGLPNRLLFYNTLQGAIERSRRRGQELAVLFIDLDQFKPVNDTHGHAAGDALLCHVGQRIKATVRREDAVARLSGDEFAVALEGVGSAADAALMARKILRAASLPLHHHGTRLQAQLSLGVAMFPGDADSAQGLLQSADAAMYCAKREGGQRLAFAPRADPGRGDPRAATGSRGRSLGPNPGSNPIPTRDLSPKAANAANAANATTRRPLHPMRPQEIPHEQPQPYRS